MNRVLYALRRYPQISESYIETEIRAVAEHDEVKILSLGRADLPATEHHPFDLVSLDDERVFRQVADGFAPDVVHGHYIHHAPALHRVATIIGRPFTVRAHSYDVLDRVMDDLRGLARTINDDLCLGMLTFPFTVDRLLDAGIDPSKLFPCYPVVDFDRFHDLGPNGTEVMNVGAALPKKDHRFYVDLARCTPERRFNLYPIGYQSAEVAEYNEAVGSPVSMMDVVPHSQMPREYKRHEWLVYTASTEKRTVGWPMAVAEAQAAGVGVCVQNIRPDLREYAGPAGFVFDDVDEVREIIAGGLPESMRRAGVAHAMRSDIRRHVGILRDLWHRA